MTLVSLIGYIYSQQSAPAVVHSPAKFT